ncbi:Holo-(acyl-carrier protein) synthase [Liberibacter crescens BT-1]|uniref:Holo-[acyl-carrier-protein] synthase n=1 Tax=Liberibacter crescens (strain BT-1) TaxID=1215343 RepID=L0ET26_LIBCB|nr:holo-ACP synthase [Liberibacter crescens]AGA64684.1 Holo-(acyl-carrier protein) synthase [Liberibacter crescens BT-1]AMC12783.1 4'-phosphopantetheinyl transferase [Liberibacter crescens]
MIIGIGVDIIDIRRIKKSIQRFGERFTEHCFTKEERDKCNSSPDPAASYAKRFAAKEACSKALGTGLAQGVSWKDMNIINSAGGKPSIVLSGGAKKHLSAIISSQFNPVIHLTISDEFPFAQAFVIIEVCHSPS